MIVPMERDGCMRALLVAVAVVLVLIEREIAIGAGIDAELDRIRWLFGCPLHLWAHGDDGAGTDKEWKLVEWSVGLYALTALLLLASPEVVPGGLRKIDGAGGCAFDIDRAQQDRRAK